MCDSKSVVDGCESVSNGRWREKNWWRRSSPADKGGYAGAFSDEVNNASVGVDAGGCGTSLGPLASATSGFCSAEGVLAAGVTTFFVGVKYRPPFEEENTEYVRARSGGACGRSSERNIAPPLLVVVDEQERAEAKRGSHGRARDVAWCFVRCEHVRRGTL